MQWHVATRKPAGSPFPSLEDLFYCPELEMQPSTLPDELQAYYAMLARSGSSEVPLRWVSLHHLVWVLEPQALWHTVVWGCTAEHRAKDDDTTSRTTLCDGSNGPTDECPQPPAGFAARRIPESWKSWSHAENGMDQAQREQFNKQVRSSH